jgi:hypothetical protein
MVSETQAQSLATVGICGWCGRSKLVWAKEWESKLHPGKIIQGFACEHCWGIYDYLLLAVDSQEAREPSWDNCRTCKLALVALNATDNEP